MRWATSALFVLAACNETFGLHSGQRVDAQYFDASIDAASACPADAPPGFSRDFDQLVVEDCVQLTISGRHAAAICGSQVAYGELDGALLLDTTLVSTIPEDGFDLPRLSADGTLLTLLDPIAAQRWDVAVFHRDGSSWTKDSLLVHDIQIEGGVSEISLDGRVLVELGDQTIHEFSRATDGTWTDLGIRIAFHPLPQLTTGIHLLPDGLHAYHTPGIDGQMQWFTRASLDDAFELRGSVEGTSTIGDPVVSDRCGALYFFTLGRLWIAPRTT